MIPIQYVTLEKLTQEEVDIIVAGLRLLNKKTVDEPTGFELTSILSLLYDLKPYTTDFKNGKDPDTEEYLKYVNKVMEE
jgi:hypothetical protein